MRQVSYTTEDSVTWTLRDQIAYEQAQARSNNAPLKFCCPNCGFWSPNQIHTHKNPLGDTWEPYCKTRLVEADQ